MSIFDIKTIETIWKNMEDVPFDEDCDGELVLAMDYHSFKKGTSRNEIWYWFDENHTKRIGYLMWNLKN